MGGEGTGPVTPSTEYVLVQDRRGGARHDRTGPHAGAAVVAENKESRSRQVTMALLTSSRTLALLGGPEVGSSGLDEALSSRSRLEFAHEPQLDLG
jgi:hypothetical protein